MNTNYILVGLVVLVIVGGGGYFLTAKSGDSMMEKKESPEMMKKEGDATMEEKKTEGDTMMKKGSYEPYAAEKLAKAETGDVVLFFRASWCPICRAVDADIRAHLSAIPSNLTILDVDYDNSAALKQKYGVTYQHTFVQVKSDGTLVKKWSGSPTLAALVAEVQ
ncbi:thioredoxin family protein [Candidatus Kaiserbacteria bacterium]|nr:thioredoxin family protein [Candidatus Kaiserbacteria bacterium]